MALYLAHKDDGTSVVSPENPISTKHTTAGEAQIVACYVCNDGKRKDVVNDTDPPPLIYNNIRLMVAGVGYTLQQPLTVSVADTIVQLNSVDGWNIGTIIKAGTERMRVEEILSERSVRVQRNYSADGVPSVAAAHQIGAFFQADASTVTLALPSVDDYSIPGVFQPAGVALADGLDPTKLMLEIGSDDTDNSVRSSDAAKYTIGAIIKIDNEKMKITNIAGNVMTVLRGYENTQRTRHTQNSIITCVGIVDVAPVTHKFFIKNDPPSGLPTQKKRDVEVSIVGDEEPL